MAYILLSSQLRSILPGNVTQAMNNTRSWVVRVRIALIGLVVLSTGCMTTSQGTRARTEVNEREDFELANEKIRRLEGDIESLQMRIQDLQRASEQSQANAAYSSQGQVGALQGTIQTLEQRVARLETNREADRQAIIDKVADLVAGSAPPAATQRRASAGYGYEHEVQAGENLSRIAQAYGVSMSAIIEANEISDPNALRVGQTLFIPE